MAMQARKGSPDRQRIRRLTILRAEENLSLTPSLAYAGRRIRELPFRRETRRPSLFGQPKHSGNGNKMPRG